MVARPSGFCTILGVHTFAEEQRGAGVPKIANPHPGRQPGPLEQRIEGSHGQVLRVHRRALESAASALPSLGGLSDVVQPAAMPRYRVISSLIHPGA